MTRMLHSAWTFSSHKLVVVLVKQSTSWDVFAASAASGHSANLTIPSLPSYDYTKGKLDELATIIIDSGAKLFVSAVGVPPKAVVERLHKVCCGQTSLLARLTPAFSTASST